MLEFSRDKGIAFFYSCRKLKSSDATFSINGFHYGEHASEIGKHFHKHAASKEHLACEAMWREPEKKYRYQDRDFCSPKYRTTGTQQVLHTSNNWYNFNLQRHFLLDSEQLQWQQAVQVQSICCHLEAPVGPVRGGLLTCYWQRWRIHRTHNIFHPPKYHGLCLHDAKRYLTFHNI